MWCARAPLLHVRGAGCGSTLATPLASNAAACGAPQTFSPEQFGAWAEPSFYDMHVITPKFLAFRGCVALGFCPRQPCRPAPSR